MYLRIILHAMYVFVCIYIDINYDIRSRCSIIEIRRYIERRTNVKYVYYTMQSYYTESHVMCVAMRNADSGAGENEKRVQRRETMK